MECEEQKQALVPDVIDNKKIVKKEKKEELNETLTIYDKSFQKEQELAIRNFVKGLTPKEEIRKRDGRSGGQVDYVNGYYMTRIANLITGFRWSHKRINIKYRPNEEDPKEIIMDVEVTWYDKSGNAFIHPGTGSKDVARYSSNKFKYGAKTGDLPIHKAGEIISLGDDIKAAETDAIKKALSYFGIANDIYGHREKNLVDQTTEEIDSETGEVIIKEEDEASKFSKFLEKQHIRWGEVYSLLNISSAEDIKDYVDATKKIKEAKGLV